MTDMPMLALMLAALACFARGLDGGRRGLLLGAGVLAGLAVVARYTGVVVFVLLPLYAWARGRRVREAYPTLAAALLYGTEKASPIGTVKRTATGGGTAGMGTATIIERV